MWYLEVDAVENKLGSQDPLPNQIPQVVELRLLHLLPQQAAKENRSLNHHSGQDPVIKRLMDTQQFIHYWRYH